uniref:NADH-ubiquinone oxidoreductase chain 6 n=1 Tax=Byrrhus sp. MJTNT-2012 TaxID=1131599 RepID=H6W8L9_9COLE|nr:NADH dehydrogenase subunit 6 [Byrrhus sp. MJTNT-2012]
MMYSMLFLSISLSISFLFLTHPMSMGLILLSQTILVTLIIGIYSSNFWFSYILFMIMVGGMLVIFIYMTSIASNEKFKFSKAITIMFLSLAFIMIFSTFIDSMMVNLNNSLPDSFNFMKFPNYKFSMNKYLNYPTNLISVTLIIYLFFTLIAVVKITNINYGPLRQKF